MDDRWFAIIGLLIATGVVWFLHRMVTAHNPPEVQSDRQMIRGLEYFVMLCLIGAFLKDEVLEILGKAQPHRAIESVLYLLGSLLASLLIYRVFSWNKP